MKELAKPPVSAKRFRAKVIPNDSPAEPVRGGIPLAELTDEELMLAYQLGSAQAFETLYARHRAKVFGYVSKRLSVRAQAEEVFQETFLRVHRFRARYDQTFPFLPWLFTICRNALVDHLRIAKRQSVETPEATESISAPLHQGPELVESIGSLPQREAEVINLHFLHGYSFEEVATKLNIQPANARKVSSRALEKLRTWWRAGV